MKKYIAIALGCLFTLPVFSQKITGKLQFETGQVYEISTVLKTLISQEMMGQAIDFNVDGTAAHTYKVTNATEENSTLHHDMKRIIVHVNGMGRNLEIDSDVESDMNGQYGKTLKEIMDKKFDIVIDSWGKVLAIKGDQTSSKAGENLPMMADLIGTLQAPLVNQPSFFKILPGESVKGDTWSDSTDSDKGKFKNTYTLSDVTDSTVVIDFTGTSITGTKAEMMGMETVSKMNNKHTGKIILDKASMIMREKTVVTESTGTLEVMGTSLPLSSKTTTTSTVKKIN